jgi:outer membrane protein assembly factor BamA
MRISWRGNAALSQAELTKLVPFEPGELFRKSKIVEGLNSAKKLYDAQGYINYVVIPTPLTDDSAGTIAFEMVVDEGEQFRFGELDVQGMEEAHREILLSAMAGLAGASLQRRGCRQVLQPIFSVASAPCKSRELRCPQN